MRELNYNQLMEYIEKYRLPNNSMDYSLVTDLNLNAKPVTHKDLEFISIDFLHN